MHFVTSSAGYTDYRELARTLPANTNSISAYGLALIERSGQVADQIVRLVADEMLLASRGCASLASCRTPAALVAAQQGLLVAWLARAMSRTTALGAVAIMSQGAAMTPFHRARTEDAERPVSPPEDDRVSSPLIQISAGSAGAR